MQVEVPVHNDEDDTHKADDEADGLLEIDSFAAIESSKQNGCEDRATGDDDTNVGCLGKFKGVVLGKEI